MEVMVIGCGGVGTRIIQLLAPSKDLSITVADGDVFERKNMDRQIFGTKYLGINKAIAMHSQYGLAGYIDKFITKEEELDGCKAVICAPDNHKCRLTALRAADKYGFMLVIAGNEEKTASACFYHGSLQGTDADPRIRYPDMMEEVVAENASSCHERAALGGQTALANSMAANFAVYMFRS